MFRAGRDGSLTTDRLVLRRWRAADREPFAALNAGPEVMEHFPARLTREESDALIDRIEEGFRRHGLGLWAVEADGAFIGFTGLNAPSWRPGVEVGWRLARSAWGHGYATEAARAALAYGFDKAGLEEILAWTSVSNVRSQAVMRRVGMTFTESFDHPQVAAGHPLRPHVLYTVRRPS